MHTMSTKFGFKMAGAGLGTAAGLAATFAPVPWLAPAVAVVGGILQLCQNVAVNKREIKQLGSRCEALLTGLREAIGEQGPDAKQGPEQTKIHDLLNNTQVMLNDIKAKMMAWMSIPKAKQFFMQDEIAEDIQRCHQGIDTLMQNFQITSHVELHNWMQQFMYNREMDQQELIYYMSDIKNSQDMTNAAVHAQGNDVRSMMLMMQTLMARFDQGDRRHIELGSTLYNIQTRTETLLPDVDLKHGEVRRIGNHPVGGSPAFDIWEGEYLGREKVAIKVIRGVEVTPKVRQRFLREVGIWRKIWDEDRGRYILPFYGACHDDGPYPYMVSPWMSNGDALSYVKKYPYVDRRMIVRRIAEGLRLLHTQDPPIAHGDIKAQNILINDNGEPLLADFGLSKIMEDLTGMPFTQSRGVSDSYRWFAPELCCAPGILSTASDVFAYAMTVLELMTGEHPFSHIKRTPEVLIRMQQGDRPRRPKDPEVDARGLDDNLWNLLTECWRENPDERPKIDEVLRRLD